jgi:hypothetical protein
MDEVGFKSPDTFDILSERTRSIRAKRDRVEWSSISLEARGVPINKARSYGVARIDNSMFRNLNGGEPTSFRVEPGEHVVVVQLSRWLRLSRYRGTSKLSIRVAVQPGERVELVFGLRPGAEEEWRSIQRARLRPILGACALIFLIVLVDGFLIPLIGSLLAPAAIAIQIRGVWIPQPIVQLVLRIAIIASIFTPLFVLGNRRFVAPNLVVVQSLRHRFRHPYFLKKAEEPLHDRQPAV